MARAKLAFASFLVLAFAAIVFGASGQGANITGSVQTAYYPDAQTVALRTGVVIADSTSIATLTSTTTQEFVLGNDGGCRSNISVSGRFSNSGQTCVVKILYLYRANGNRSGPPTTVLGSTLPITLTAGTLTDPTTGFFEAPTFYFDASGATSARVVVITAPGAGSVDFWLGSW